MNKYRVTVEFQQTLRAHFDVDAKDKNAAQDMAMQAVVDGILDAPDCREIKREAGEIELVSSDATLETAAVRSRRPKHEIQNNTRPDEVIGTPDFDPKDLDALTSQDWLRLIADYDQDQEGLTVVKKSDGSFVLVDLVNVGVGDEAA